MESPHRYSRERPSPHYVELIRLHAALHDARDANPAKRRVFARTQRMFSGVSLLPQLLRVRSLIRRTEARTILDYGSGKGLQYGALPIVSRSHGRWPDVRSFWGVREIRCYDPACEPISELPLGPFDGVVCTDVLEHCAPDDVPWILEEVFGLARGFVFLAIACHAAVKALPDGRNAHSTVRPPGWWKTRLESVARRHSVLWEAWLQLDLPSAASTGPNETRVGNAPATEEQIEIVRIGGLRARPPVLRRLLGRRAPRPAPAGRTEARGLLGLAECVQVGGPMYAFRRLVNTSAFLGYPVYSRMVRPIAWLYARSQTEGTLSALLKDRRVLVLGTGPSADELSSVPDDVLILTCNQGLRLLESKGIHRKVDLYYYANKRVDRRGIEVRDRIADSLSRATIDVLICEDLLPLMDVGRFRANYSRLLIDFLGGELFLRRLIRPHRLRDVRGSSFCPWSSSGIRLLQYALYFGARETYVLGIDLGTTPSGTDPSAGRPDHCDIDGRFLEVVASRHCNIFSLSERCLASRYFPVARAWSACEG